MNKYILGLFLALSLPTAFASKGVNSSENHNLICEKCDSCAGGQKCSMTQFGNRSSNNKLNQPSKGPTQRGQKSKTSRR